MVNRTTGYGDMNSAKRETEAFGPRVTRLLLAQPFSPLARLAFSILPREEVPRPQRNVEEKPSPV